MKRLLEILRVALESPDEFTREQAIAECLESEPKEKLRRFAQGCINFGMRLRGEVEAIECEE